MKIQKVNIKVIEEFFKNYNHNSEPVTLSVCEKIINLDKFVESHLEVLKNNSGNKIVMPFYDRLLKVYHILNVIDI